MNAMKKMRRLELGLAVGLSLAGAGAAAAASAAEYEIDPGHSFIELRIKHLGYSWLS